MLLFILFFRFFVPNSLEKNMTQIYITFHVILNLELEEHFKRFKPNKSLKSKDQILYSFFFYLSFLLKMI